MPIKGRDFIDSLRANPVIQLAILKGILPSDIISTLASDQDPVAVLIEQGILHPEQVEKLQKELALDGFDTMWAPIDVKDSPSQESAERIAVFGRYVQLEPSLMANTQRKDHNFYHTGIARDISSVTTHFLIGSTLRKNWRRIKRTS